MEWMDNRMNSDSDVLGQILQNDCADLGRELTSSQQAQSRLGITTPAFPATTA
jgi:hypothetical protein